MVWWWQLTSNGASLNNAKIKLKSLLDSKRRVTKSKASGVFEITSTEAGDYLFTVSASGKTTITDKILILIGNPLKMEFDLV